MESLDFKEEDRGGVNRKKIIWIYHKRNSISIKEYLASFTIMAKSNKKKKKKDS